eukprot:Phypoly_transcript_17691.p1 GENE.Phypoly_transcript_17691~~Phypoly_transcript_17691.p1  ORF type:complete len:258 (+),score=46.39 Phypoly_transcript_17691:3-776(+)
MDELVAFVVSTGPKHFKSSWPKFLLNLLAVIAHLKPAHLIDYVSPPWDILCTYFTTLKRYPAAKSIALLKICDDVFVINTALLKAKIEKDLENSFSSLVFIDVRPFLPAPKLLTDVPVSKLDVDKILKFCDTSCVSLHLLEIATPYPPTLFGYLLGYPTLYSNSSFLHSSPSSSSNCLSFQPLKLNKVILCGFILACTNSTCSQDFESLSFTFPVALQPKIDMAQWWEEFCKRFVNQKVWEKCTLEVTDVCLEHIVL